MIRLLLALVTSILFAGCMSGGSSGNDGQASGDGSRTEPLSGASGSVAVPFTDVTRTQTSSVRTTQLVAVTNASDWSTAWLKHAGRRVLPMPVIDFSKNMVVGVFLGTRPDGCYHVRINAIERADDHIMIRYQHLVPTPDMICTQATVQPVHLVQIETSTLPVLFAKDPDATTP